MARSSSYNPERPQYEWGSKWRKNGVTEKQAALISKNAGQINITVDLDKLNRGSASSLIDEMMRYCPKGEFVGYSKGWFKEYASRASAVTFPEGW